MNLEQTIHTLKQQHDVVDVIDLSFWNEDTIVSSQRLLNKLKLVWRESYTDNQRILFLHTCDYYSPDNQSGVILKYLQALINEVDISNFFCLILTTNSEIQSIKQNIEEISKDPVSMQYQVVDGEFQKNFTSNYKKGEETYKYGSVNPVKISVEDLDDREKFLLTESKVFCIYPWVHLHAYPTGDAYPCCQATMKSGIVGNCKTQTLEEIWRGEPMQQLRQAMLSETPHAACTKCYEQEDSGFFSGRNSANKHHGHQIKKLETNPFEITYWDIRFSNLCNLSCRSCGHIFSSSWYSDQAALAGPEWKANNKPLKFAGRTEIDMWEQLIPHLDYVEQIYFAGGEPLMMEEHYNILEELERRGRFDVRLIYNTNFTHVKLKDRYVFDYWKKFKSVAVGASLDAMGPRAEYIRKGTDWAVVEQNRIRMLETCPNVDFYISPTLSILNAMHITDFHRDWVDRGLLQAQDLNVNILQDPIHYRIDIATPEYKQQIKQKFEDHLLWLRPQDSLQRATVGFESAINFMMSTDNTDLIPKFWTKTQQLDTIRQENVLDVLPELKALR
jgi:radical SAM protein with 4Fe4S-binding SPASM domain